MHSDVTMALVALGVVGGFIYLANQEPLQNPPEYPRKGRTSASQVLGTFKALQYRAPSGFYNKADSPYFEP